VKDSIYIIFKGSVMTNSLSILSLRAYQYHNINALLIAK